MTDLIAIIRTAQEGAEQLALILLLAQVAILGVFMMGIGVSFGSARWHNRHFK